MAFRKGSKWITIVIFLYHIQSFVSGQVINGDWSPWQVDPDIDCCVYGPYGLYKRFCNNPSPEGNGTLCKTLNNTYAPVDQEWRTCNCGCYPACDNVTSFCANDTGKPAYCQCNYGLVPPSEPDPNNVTYCVIPTDTTTTPLTVTTTAYSLPSSTKNTLKAFGYIICIALIACLGLCIILNLITGNVGKDRLIQMCEEITLIVVHVLIVFGAEAVSSAGFCKATSAMLHYFFMCTMAFFCLEALHTYSMVTYVVPRNGYLPWWGNILMGFGIPLIPLAFALGFQMSLYGTNGRHCWCDLSTFQSWSFLFPMGFAGFVTMIIAEAQGQGRYHPLPDIAQNQFISAKISKASIMFIMPLTLASYICGLIAVDQQSVAVYVLFFILNIIVAIVMLFFHTAGSPKIRALSGKLCICFRCCMKDIEETPETKVRPPTAKVAPVPLPEKEPIPVENPEEHPNMNKDNMEKKID